MADRASHWRRAAAVCAIATCITSLCFGLVRKSGRGEWPKDWPTELEPFRGQAKTFLIATGTQSDVFEISFRSRDEFERIWPVILTLKSDGSPLTLTSIGGASWANLYDNNSPVARIHAPSYTSRGPIAPDGNVLRPSPPWPDSAKLPNGQLPEYVIESDDGTTWVPFGANHKHAMGFHFRARIELELVVDGRIIDLNRIKLPGDTPIIDNRTLPFAADANGS